LVVESLLVVVVGVQDTALLGSQRAALKDDTTSPACA
jgi:hypothetical protein